MISHATQAQPSAAVIRPQIRSQAMRVIRKKKKQRDTLTYTHTYECIQTAQKIVQR